MFFFLIAILVGCGPNLGNLGNINKSLAESLSTKYEDRTTDFWSQVDGTYKNSQNSTLNFDRNSHTIEIDTSDRQVHRSLLQVSKSCPKNSKNCYCWDGGCEYSVTKVLPCTTHIDGIIKIVNKVRDPFAINVGNIVTFTVKKRAIFYSNKIVEAEKANKNGTLVQQLKYYCESLLLDSKEGEDISINLIYDSKKVVWTSGNVFGLMMLDGSETFVHTNY